MNQNMMAKLDAFFAEKTIADANRDTYIVCNLKDSQKKLTISLVFMRDWDSIEADDYRQIVVEGKGAVLTFPCYWISIPKELAMAYFEIIINTLYEEEFNTWNTGVQIPGNDANQGSGNTNCPYIAPQSSN